MHCKAGPNAVTCIAPSTNMYISSLLNIISTRRQRHPTDCVANIDASLCNGADGQWNIGDQVRSANWQGAPQLEPAGGTSQLRRQFADASPEHVANLEIKLQLRLPTQIVLFPLTWVSKYLTKIWDVSFSSIWIDKLPYWQKLLKSNIRFCKAFSIFQF